MTEKDKTLTLIKKLLDKADSAAAIGSTAEAGTFAAKASELLLKHKLEMTDLEALEQDNNDKMADFYFDPVDAARIKMGKGRRAAWLEGLVSSIARAHFCRILIIPGSKRVRLIGRDSDVAIVKYLVGVLAHEAVRLSVLYERVSRVSAQRAGLPIPNAPKRGFLLGFTAAIIERLRSTRAEVQHTGGIHAVLRFTKAENDVVQYIKHNIKTSKVGGFSAGAVTTNGSAWVAGQAAGRKVSLNTGLSGGTVKSQGTLSKGLNLLEGTTA